jgi:hypothetical protein
VKTKVKVGSLVRTSTRIVGQVRAMHANGYLSVQEVVKVGNTLHLTNWRRLVASSEIVSVYSAGSKKAVA